MFISKIIKSFVAMVLILFTFHFWFPINLEGNIAVNKLHRWAYIGLKTGLSSRLSICMMLPVTSRGISYNKTLGLRFSDLPLVHSFLPSLLNTIEEQYSYRLYIGYDYGDPFYDNASNWATLLKIFNSYATKGEHSRFHVQFNPRILYGIDQRITAIWNTLAAIAYNDSCDYFYPANDDLHLATSGWTTAAIRELQKCPVANNFGVVAFRDLSACGYPTFHLTHRTHLDLHDGIYYPLPSHGAHQDPWIFSMYRAWNCAFFLSKYELRNHIGISVIARYDYGVSQLPQWIQRSRLILFNRLLALPSSRYNQSHVNSNDLNSQIDWLVPC
jgi:hypothetical protein